MSVLQVAVASFVEGKRIPPALLKAALVPGVARAVNCLLLRRAIQPVPKSVNALLSRQLSTSQVYKPAVR